MIDQPNHADDGHRGHAAAAKGQRCCALQNEIQTAEKRHNDQQPGQKAPGVAGNRRICSMMGSNIKEHLLSKNDEAKINRFPGTRRPGAWPRCEQHPEHGLGAFDQRLGHSAAPADGCGNSAGKERLEHPKRSPARRSSRRIRCRVPRSARTRSPDGMDASAAFTICGTPERQRAPACTTPAIPDRPSATHRFAPISTLAETRSIWARAASRAKARKTPGERHPGLAEKGLQAGRAPQSCLSNSPSRAGIETFAPELHLSRCAPARCGLSGYAPRAPHSRRNALASARRTSRTRSAT